MKKIGNFLHAKNFQFFSVNKLLVLVIVLILSIPITNAEFFRIANVETSPEKIDRRTATLTEVPVQIQTILLANNPRQEPEIIATTAKCESKDLSDYFLIRETTRTPIIVAKLWPDTEKENTRINCTLTLTLLDNNQTKTETKQIQKTIPLYASELGEIDQVLENKIINLNEEIHDYEKQIANWKRTNRFLGQVASFAETSAKTDAIVTTVIGIIWPIAAVLEKIPTPYTKAAGKILWTVVGKALHAGHTGVITLTWNPGYAPTGLSTGLSSFTKAITIIQSCQICDYKNAYTALIEQSAGKKIFTLDDKQGKPTTLEQFTIYEWEPYKSMHMAQACLCPPAITYNLEKERQLKCIYRNCVEQNAEYGFPLSECEKTLKQQQCLYIDGAAWKIAGGNAAAQIFSEITNAVLKQLPVITTGITWQIMCDYNRGFLSDQAYPETFGKPDILADWAVPLCAVTAGLQMLEETDFFEGNKYKWDQYTGKLQGEDFC
ncbi:hypothetical protein GF358_03460 [Candidatus Woesearchaeota archaeon]|nr:hypothetical protein [Candidatus Woesearchaeota archaeon]